MEFDFLESDNPRSSGGIAVLKFCKNYTNRPCVVEPYALTLTMITLCAFLSIVNFHDLTPLTPFHPESWPPSY